MSDENDDVERRERNRIRVWLEERAEALRGKSGRLGIRNNQTGAFFLKQAAADLRDLDTRYPALVVGNHCKPFSEQVRQLGQGWSELDRHCMWLLRRSVLVLQNSTALDATVKAAISQALSDAARDLREGKEP